MITLSSSSNKDLDDINLKILNFLINDGRKSFKSISKEIGVTSPTIKNRFENMLKDGIINQISAKINPKQLGYNISTFLNITLHSNKSIPKVIRYLELIEGVFQIFLLAGMVQVKVLCYSKNMDEFSLMFAKISQIHEIKEVNSEIVLNGSTMGKFLDT